MAMEENHGSLNTERKSKSQQDHSKSHISDHQQSNGNKHDGHDHHDHHRHMIEDFKKRFWISLYITIPIIIMAPMIQDLAGYSLRFNGDRYVQLALSTFIFFYGGWPFLIGLADEIKKRSPGMMTLIGLAITVAYVYSSAVVIGLEGKIFFWELASLIVVMLLGHWIEMRSVMGASNSLQELVKMLPSEARIISKDGSFKDVPLSEVKSGDKLLIRPGESIPADARVVDGESHVNESMITGESTPVKKSTDDEVIGGSVNGNAALTVEVRHTGEDTYLSKVIDMVSQAQKSKSKTQNFADKAAAWLFYIALGSGIITLIVWLSLGKPFDYSLERMVTVMIISCPHALGLAIPLVVAISTSVSAKNGLLIRNRTAFEQSRNITCLIFDKTGTLTKGEFGVTRYDSFAKEIEQKELLIIASSVESKSEHPIATGIIKKAKEEGIKINDSSSFMNITGEGVEAKVSGIKYRIVSPGYLKKKQIKIPENITEIANETVVYVLQNQELIGYFALADEIREDAKEAVNKLQQKGIKVLMATGDNEKAAKSVSQALNLDDYYAQVLPEDKQAIIKNLQNKGEVVAMTGDGVNDAPALAQADIGIAVGSGTDVAAETADIILVNSKPSDIKNLIFFGEATYQKMVQNLFWAAGYNIIAIPLAAGVMSAYGILLSPAIGAALMSLSTIIVAVNAQLLKNRMRS